MDKHLTTLAAPANTATVTKTAADKTVAAFVAYAKEMKGIGATAGALADHGRELGNHLRATAGLDTLAAVVGALHETVKVMHTASNADAKVGAADADMRLGTFWKAQSNFIAAAKKSFE